MVVPRPATSLLVLSLALAPACAHPPHPATAAKPAPQETAPPPATTPGETADPASPANPAKPEPARNGRVVVVDPGEDAASHPKTLVEAAREERERRSHAGEPVAVITNKTLPHSKGQLTFAQPAAKPAKTVGTATAKSDGKAGEKEIAPGALHDEAYWRKHGLDIRQRLHRAAEEISKLEQDVADWRRRFYSEADPARRDAQIKPEWDRSLDRLQHKKEEVDATRLELNAYVDEGRRAGALPGWLREGAELEPPLPRPPPAPTDAIEPLELPQGPP